MPRVPDRDVPAPADDACSRIIRQLTAQIRSGAWRPGQQLPPRSRLMTDLGVGAATLHAACAHLVAAGQIVSDGRRGTRVAERPACRQRVLVLAEQAHLATEPRNAFVAAALAAFGTAADVIGLAGDVPESPSIRRLQRALGDGAVRGALSLINPQLIPDTLAACAGTGLISVAGHDGSPDVACVVIDDRPVIATLCRLAVSAGCRRPLLLSRWRREGAWRATLLKIATAHGLDAQLIALPPGDDDEIAATVAILARLRPDGWIITDDNLLAGVARALHGQRRRRPVIAHGNFPQPLPCSFPVLRAGPDIDALVAQALRWMDINPPATARWLVPIATAIPESKRGQRHPC